MWPFGKKTQPDSVERDFLQNKKLLESQQALIEAATTTTAAANYVTRKLKDKLDDSIEQFENTAKILYDALIICDIDGNIQAFNPAAEIIFGKTNEESKNMFFGDLIFCETHDVTNGSAIWELFQQIDDAEENHDLHGLKNGEHFRIDVNHTILERSDGSIIVLMIIKEMTVHEAVAKKLIGYKSIFESFVDGIIVIRNKNIVAANDAASKILGLPIENILGHGLEEITNEAIDDASGMIDISFTSANIIWEGAEAMLLTIRDMTSEIKNEDNMICCFGPDFLVTFTNTTFSKFYNAKVGDDIRSLLADDERHAMMINISKLSNTESSRSMKLQNEKKTQVWTDCFNETDGVIEYQRIGKIL